MKVFRLLILFAIVLSTVTLSVTLLNTPTEAQMASSQFRMKFIMNRRTNMLKQQEYLVKQSKDIMPGEIESIINDALLPEKTFEERMYFLDHANAMATMYKHEFGDDSYLAKIQTIQKMELSKQEQEVRERSRWFGYEGLRGSILMKEHLPQMEEKGQNAVVYPHWLHQIFFTCKTCHADNMSMKKGANDFSHAEFKEGRQCGACHNAKISFDSEDPATCDSCHVREPQLVQRYAAIDHEAIKNIASRVNSVWDPDKLEEGVMPLDATGAVDWLKLETMGASRPATSILPEASGEALRDTFIVFRVKSEEPFNDVLFSHKVHTTRVNCATCHANNRIFKPELGSNKLSMAEMATGSQCGTCHGKVSFPLTNCQRCHSLAPGTTPKGALVRE